MVAQVLFLMLAAHGVNCFTISNGDLDRDEGLFFE